ncbi:MAG: disulfide bond formation protein B, partial [Pseudomonadota bacterium]
SCTEAPWRMFGLSMAGYNTVVSAGLALISFIAASATIGPARSSGPGAHQLSSSTSQ